MTNQSKTFGCLHSITNEWDFPMNLTCVRKDLYLAKVGHKIGVLCILMRDIEVHRVFVIRSSFHWTLFSQFHKSQLSWLSVFGYFHLQHKLPSFHSQKKLPWQPITFLTSERTCALLLVSMILSLVMRGRQSPRLIWWTRPVDHTNLCHANQSQQRQQCSLVVV